MEKNLKLIYMGTPEFAVAPLKALITNGYRVEAVVTAPDKPAGRGQRMQSSPVKSYAQSVGLPLFQPYFLKDPQFIAQLENLTPDIILVVAFRLIPPEIWKLTRIGAINLHASLLPDYRGAAPIQRAIMNGETITGITTFFIDEGIDKGKIILQEVIPIGETETAGSLHFKMMQQGAELVLKTLDTIARGNYQLKDQGKLICEKKLNLHYAPKISKEDCKIIWHNSAKNIFNQIRALNPHPGADTLLMAPDQTAQILKVYYATPIFEPLGTITPGSINTDGKSFLQVACGDGFIELTEIQLSGKKRMDIALFLRGFKLDNRWTLI